MSRIQQQSGFTLLEILIVLTIISILTAISLPQYNDYRMQAFDTRALTDLRNVAISEEAYFMNTEKYLSCTGDNCKELPGISRLSKGVVLVVDAYPDYFIAKAHHPQGSGKEYIWDSDKGGIQQ